METSKIREIIPFIKDFGNAPALAHKMLQRGSASTWAFSSKNAMIAWLLKRTKTSALYKD